MGFLNLYHFNLALNAVTLWRLLNQQSIWHQVIFDKYLHNNTLFYWLRQPAHNLHAVSRIWASLVRSLHVLNHWISWNPGTGQLIAIGRDKILGMGDASLLSSELVEALNLKQIHSLAQASSHRDPATLAEVWKSSKRFGSVWSTRGGVVFIHS
jgi:hypothetical protein